MSNSVVVVVSQQQIAFIVKRKPSRVLEFGQLTNSIQQVGFTSPRQEAYQSYIREATGGMGLLATPVPTTGPSGKPSTVTPEVRIRRSLLLFSSETISRPAES